MGYHADKLKSPKTLKAFSLLLYSTPLLRLLRSIKSLDVSLREWFAPSVQGAQLWILSRWPSGR